MSNRRLLRAGYDIDDVLLGFVRSFLPFASKKIGREIKYENFRDYNIGNSFGISGEEGQQLLVDFCKEDCLESLQPIEGALEAIQQLSVRAQNFCLTARDFSHSDVTRRTLKRHFFDYGVDVEEIYFCYNHHSGTGNERKSDIAARLKLHYMVEDSPQNALEIADKGIPVFLLRRPWNSHIQSRENIIICNDWNDVVSGVQIRYPN